MRSDRNGMSIEERTMFELHALYEKYGYSRFKMGKFEEYDLYVQNKDFISAESIITFGDMSGRLKALKPDLTLSIVKNYRYVPGFDQKLYYSENIYRASQDSQSFREMKQTGLECMGDIGLYDTFEVTMLAVRSLAAISGDYVLQVSHMGLIESFLEPIPVLLPINILSKFSSIISMSLRLFGNILCGSILMSLVYTGAQGLSNLIAGLFGSGGGVFNFMAPVIAPLLHAYFDCFAGFIQTLVFVTLTLVFVGVEVPDELK